MVAVQNVAKSWSIHIMASVNMQSIIKQTQIYQVLL